MEVPAGGAGSDLQEHPGPGAAPLPHLQGSPQLPANDMLFWPGTAACDVCPQQRDTGGGRQVYAGKWKIPGSKGREREKAFGGC